MNVYFYKEYINRFRFSFIDIFFLWLYVNFFFLNLKLIRLYFFWISGNEIIGGNLRFLRIGIAVGKFFRIF